MSFQYQDLDWAKREIRLISFVRNGKEPLEMTLSVISRDSAPQYHCLSYVWGDPTLVFPVVINGCSLLVTQNLGEALTRMAQEDIDFLWADGLCIDQADDVDKSRHVQSMGDIFAEAWSVLAWLGPEADSSSLVMEEIERAGSIILEHFFSIPQAEDGELLPLSATARQSLRELGRLLVFQMLDRLKDGFDTSAWEKLGRDERHAPIAAWYAFFHDRPYWSRVWILQELAVAQRAVLFCGPSKVSLHKLLAHHHFLERSWYRSQFGPTVWPLASKHDQFWCVNKTPALGSFFSIVSSVDWPHQRLLDLIMGTQKMNASVAHDRVFAMLTLTTDDDRVGIDVDYSRPVEEYLQIIVRNGLSQGRCSLAPLRSTVRAWAKDCPSWVALSSPSVGLQGYIRDMATITCTEALEGSQQPLPLVEPFRASGGKPFNPGPDCFSRAGNMQLPCVVIGTVQRHHSLQETEDQAWQRLAHLDGAFGMGSRPERVWESKEERTRQEFLSLHQIVRGGSPPETHWEITSSCLVAMNVSRNLVSFLEAPDLLTIKESPEQRRMIWSLLIPHGRPNRYGSEEFQLQQETTLDNGFYNICACSGGASALAQRLSDATTDPWDAVASLVDSMNPTAKVISLYSNLVCFFETTNGFRGLVSGCVEEGDRLVIFPGFSVPYLVRPKGANGNIYELMREAWVPGVMYGELFEGESEPETVLVDLC